MRGRVFSAPIRITGGDHMKRLSVLILAALLLAGASPALAARCRVRGENAARFGQLLRDLVIACEVPGSDPPIEADLAAIRAASEPDGDLARAIADHWRAVFLDPGYTLRLWDGGDVARALEGTALRDSRTHAFVVLGYALQSGEMAPELVGRCGAAAAAARAFPHALVICSGGATGTNNPEEHTEAGLMKAWLTEQGGIDPDRIFIDEKAKSTQENAANTFRILQEQGVRTITIVTSAYHQRWGQAVYHAMAALASRDTGFSVEIVENYCYDIPPAEERYLQGERIAVRQIAGLLGLPKEATAGMFRGL